MNADLTPEPGQKPASPSHKPLRYTVRAYGLWVVGPRVLVSLERRFDMDMLKFPGGGLEAGEGLRDGLHREFVEELGTAPLWAEHFYTTDIFVASAFDKTTQVLSVYYRVGMPPGYSVDAAYTLQGAAPLADEEQRFIWLPIEERLADLMTFPIDKIVAGMLLGLRQSQGMGGLHPGQ